MAFSFFLLSTSMMTSTTSCLFISSRHAHSISTLSLVLPEEDSQSLKSHLAG